MTQSAACVLCEFAMVQVDDLLSENATEVSENPHYSDEIDILLALILQIDKNICYNFIVL